MAGEDWSWKSKSGGTGGLLYEAGNWGDILKMLWIAEILRWKERAGAAVRYIDPFAGDVRYPMGRKTAFRLAQCALPQFDFLREAFLCRGAWPSAASGALLLATGGAEVWDADEGRRGAWERAGVPLAEHAASGWDIVARLRPDPDALLLVDPYDVLAGWREHVPLLAEKSAGTSLLLYLYNRSGKRREIFADYRRFRGRLDDLTEGRAKRIGRIAADAFLPDAHHEVLFLPCAEDAARPGFGAMLEGLGECAAQLRRAQERAGAFDC